MIILAVTEVPLTVPAMLTVSPTATEESVDAAGLAVPLPLSTVALVASTVYVEVVLFLGLVAVTVKVLPLMALTVP